MKHIVSMAAVLVAIALASKASAQVQTGSILVKATDEQGGSTPGALTTKARRSQRTHEEQDVSSSCAFVPFVFSW